jgi:hypothetical protein
LESEPRDTPGISLFDRTQYDPIVVRKRGREPDSISGPRAILERRFVLLVGEVEAELV